MIKKEDTLSTLARAAGGDPDAVEELTKLYREHHDTVMKHGESPEAFAAFIAACYAGGIGGTADAALAAEWRKKVTQ